MGDADQRPKQIEWVEISTYVAALDRALYQRINRSLDLAAGTFIQFRGGLQNDRIQCRGDDPLCCNVVNQQEHLGSQRFNRRHGLSESAFRCRQFLDFGPVDRLNQCMPSRKVAIEFRVQLQPAWQYDPGSRSRQGA